jgi:ATP-dependent protease ClpP protease subunit
MECSKVKIQTVAIGCVASMASLIFVCGTPGLRVMSRNAYIMTHQFSEYLEGKYHDLVAARSHEDELHARFVDFYKKHSNMTEQQINDILLKSSDTYINAEKALEYGLCDKIADPWEESN